MLHVVPAGALALPAGAATLIKNALMLDGATDYLQLSFSGEGSNTKGTISFWVRRNKTGEAFQNTEYGLWSVKNTRAPRNMPTLGQ